MAPRFRGAIFFGAYRRRIKVCRNRLSQPALNAHSHRMFRTFGVSSRADLIGALFL
jgi:hypothetical protein